MVVAVEGMIKEAGSKAGSRQPIETPSIICKWLVLDGDLHPDWVDNMASLLDCGQSLSLASGQQIQLHGDYKFIIFKPDDLISGRYLFNKDTCFYATISIIIATCLLYFDTRCYWINLSQHVTNCVFSSVTKVSISPDSTSVIFELLDLTNASPSTITQCALVHCHPGSLSWKSLVESWMHMAKQRWVMTTAR